MALSQDDLLNLITSFNQASAYQKQAILQSVIVNRETFQNIMSITPKEMNIYIAETNTTVKETSFIDMITSFVEYKLAKGISTQQKKKLLGAGGTGSPEEEAALKKIAQTQAKLGLVKQMEEVYAARLKNKQFAEEFVSMTVLLDIMSQAFGNVINVLRAKAMMSPRLVPIINECISEICECGELMVQESIRDTEKYLEEFKVTEKEWASLMIELDEAKTLIDELDLSDEDPTQVLL